MNKTQRLIAGIGLFVVAVVLHFALCSWSPETYTHVTVKRAEKAEGRNVQPDRVSEEVRILDTHVFVFIYVRKDVHLISGVLLGIVCPIVFVVGGAILVVRK